MIGSMMLVLMRSDDNGTSADDSSLETTNSSPNTNK